MISAGLAYSGDSPCADRARNHADGAQNVKGPPLEVLAGDVFESLPARPQIDAIAHLGIARDGADFGIDKVRHQACDRIRSDDGVGIDAYKKFRLANVFNAVVERLGLARVPLGEN